MTDVLTLLARWTVLGLGWFLLGGLVCWTLGRFLDSDGAVIGLGLAILGGVWFAALTWAPSIAWVMPKPLP